MNRIVDKVRKKIGQSKGRLDNSLNLEEFKDSATPPAFLGTDVRRVSTSRNSMAEEAHSGTAYFKKPTKARADAMEASRAKGKSMSRVSQAELCKEENEDNAERHSAVP